ncbi:hypothetical protein BDV12DRAFT_167709 [Aspergillus spectabilis]
MADSTRNCYFPSGTIAETNVPCSGKEYTSCCDYRDICLSNGLCLGAGQQPYTLSRGSCTNQKWDQGCPEYCGDANPDGGSSIVNFSFRNGVSRYCCGTAVSNDSTIACRDGDDFTVPSGDVIPGYALLANVTSLSIVRNEPTVITPMIPECHEAAIGAGVGVPLGVIALTSIAWALFERRRRKRVPVSQLLYTETSTAPSKPPGTFDSGVYAADKKHRLSELDSKRPIAELNA